MKRSLLCLAAVATLTLGTTAAFAGATGNNQTRPEATTNTASATTQPATVDRRTSNWPDLPERQAGKSYRQVITSPFGYRERNFESGRR